MGEVAFLAEFPCFWPPTKSCIGRDFASNLGAFLLTTGNPGFKGQEVTNATRHFSSEWLDRISRHCTATPDLCLKHSRWPAAFTLKIRFQRSNIAVVSRFRAQIWLVTSYVVTIASNISKNIIIGQKTRENARFWWQITGVRGEIDSFKLQMRDAHQKSTRLEVLGAQEQACRFYFFDGRRWTGCL